jgi:hypothetical protein
LLTSLETKNMSTFATVIGLVAAACTTAANFPQLKKAWTTGQTDEAVVPIGKFMKKIKKDQIPRVPGTAVFPDADATGCAASNGLASETQSSATPTPIRSNRQHAVGT